jgi:sugar O-acyltransferase (sialic acid O-acetyltransferase NeuD family)
MEGCGLRIVLVGGGGHASDVLGAFEAGFGLGQHPVVGIVADVEIDSRCFAHRGVRQIGDISDLKWIDASHYIIAVGFSHPRQEVFARVSQFGRTPATIVHPKADIPKGVPIGEGTVILSGARVSPMTRIGKHVYLSHGCLVGHDCEILDFATVLPGAAVSGNTILGEASLIGTNAAIIQGLRIGTRAIVGAGAVVLRDVASNTTVVGNPAKALKAKTTLLNRQIYGLHQDP